MSELTRLERDLLESMAGKRTHHHDNGSPIMWGAWMSVCLESLEGGGYIQADHTAKGYTYTLTPAGIAALEQ